MYALYQEKDIADLFMRLGDDLAASNLMAAFPIKRHEQKGYPAV